MLEHRGTFVGAEPVPDAKAQLLHSPHAADPSNQFWTQKACVSGFVGDTTDGCELLVDGVGRQPSRLRYMR